MFDALYNVSSRVNNNSNNINTKYPSNNICPLRDVFNKVSNKFSIIVKTIPDQGKEPMPFYLYCV